MHMIVHALFVPYCMHISFAFMHSQSQSILFRYAQTQKPMAGRVLFIDFCKVLERISLTPKRLEIQKILTDHLKDVYRDAPEALVAVLYLSTATVYPEHFNIELGVGEGMLMGVVAEYTGKSVVGIKDEYFKEGDLGIVVMKYRVSQLFISQVQLDVQAVLDGLRRVSAEQGTKCVAVKKMIILGMMSKCSPLEAKYLVRLIEGRLKIGLALKTVLISLAGVFSEDMAYEVKSAFNRQPDIGRLAECVVDHGIAGLREHFQVTPGIPLKPMLANSSNGITAAFKKVEGLEFICEYKYDGERIQIHKYGSKVETFSRNSENSTEKYPDLMDVYNVCEKDFIVDGEVVAYDRNEKKILPFQTLTTRKRKRVDEKKIDVYVCVFVFDLIYFDGRSYVDEPLEKRRSTLRNEFKQIEGKFCFAESVDCKKAEDVEQFFEKSVDGNFEGIMMKTLGTDAVYHPSQRSNKWIKIKKDYLESMSDSLDLVVMGAYYGKGKRTGWYGGFLLGVYNDEDDKFESLCKIGTGFADASLENIYEQLNSNLCAAPKNYVYKDSAKPDVWVEAKYVWEVKAAGISVSPTYCAGAMDGKGMSLRFPRFVRERGDKDVRDVSTSAHIRQMYLDANVEDSEDFC